jgi:hypothetical protein
MVNQDPHETEAEDTDRIRRPLRLPGFINDTDVALGDVVKGVSHALGLRPCRGCEQRAATLSRWLVFAGRSTRLR